MTRAAATLPLAFCLLLAGPVLRAEGANLNVTVHNLKNAEGQVIIAVFDSKENYLDEMTAFVQQWTTAFPDMRSETYAVVAYHDKNENKDLDRLIVVPREAYGFSNDARGMFGPAKFKSAAIEVGEEDMAIEIKAK